MRVFGAVLKDQEKEWLEINTLTEYEIHCRERAKGYAILHKNCTVARIIEFVPAETVRDNFAMAILVGRSSTSMRCLDRPRQHDAAKEIWDLADIMVKTRGGD